MPIEQDYKIMSFDITSIQTFQLTLKSRKKMGINK